jgi:membrane-bound metal-dependent hydrolase YbcI (DUF457 family)
MGRAIFALMKKKLLICAGIVLGFLVLSYAFVPELLGGKIVNQSDISGWQGMSHEKLEWDKAHPGEPAAWTGSMFSGMPTATIQASRKGDWTQPLYDLLLTGKRPATYLFVSLLGAFLLMLAFGIHPLIAAGGAIAVTFCAYNIQIIQVGHNTKMQALAFLPWVLAALVFTYRASTRCKIGQVLLGAALFGLTVSFQVKANHPQISYYLALMILIYVVVLFVSLLRRKESLKGFWIASALLLVMGVAGIGTNAIKLMPTVEYTPYSMRGGTTGGSTEGGDRKGLKIDYATAWSYGWEELPNIAIPNYNGGSSTGELPMDSETVQLLKRAGQGNLAQVRKHLPLYWGPQPFTAGPMYMGAITIFLFILGLLYWKGRERWWAVTATLLAVLLALGSHFLWFTRLFYDFVPLYNKFRTVSMALVVLQFTLPVLGFLMLDGIVNSGAEARVLRRQVLTAGGISAGLLLVLALLQSTFGAFSGAVDSGQPDILVDALVADRYSLLWKDALRSLLLVAGAVVLLVWGISGKESSGKKRFISAILVCVLVLVDMFFVGKRYLGPDDFVTPKAFQSQFTKRPVDEMILRDTDPSYRVLDLTVNVFNDSHPSYWHKNIGGYSPAKLQRYQEYIDARISPDLSALSKALSGAATVAEAEAAMPYLESLASLNCRYIILGENNAPVRYKYARGNAWFEDEGEIEMTKYTPDRLEYSYASDAGGRAVFSEVYYPAGWVARLEDGTELPVNLYEGGSDAAGSVAAGLLRCIDLPAGQHTLTMSFEPASYRRGEALSRACSILLILLVLGGIAMALRGNKKKDA